MGRIACASLLPSFLVVSGVSGQIEKAAEVRNTIRLEPQFDFAVGGGTAHGIAFHPDGSKFATGGEEGDLRLWDTETWTVLWTKQASDHWIGTIRFSPDSPRPITASFAHAAATSPVSSSG